jgi:hypothetical protein
MIKNTRRDRFAEHSRSATEHALWIAGRVNAT